MIHEVVVKTATVETAVVFGVPDPKWKEAICAVCQLIPGETLSEKALISFVGDRIARYKKPRHVVFTDEMPLLKDGSPDRATVKEKYKDYFGLRDIKNYFASVPFYEKLYEIQTD